MRRSLMFVVALVLVAGLLAFMVTFTVRFNEAAVKTRFGKASETTIYTEPGLKFKWFYPIESVTKYDTRQRILPTSLEQLQTSDNRQITVESFLVWRVSDPLVFFQRFSHAGEREEDHYRMAEAQLLGNLRSAISEVSRYRMADLFTREVGASKLPELETAILRTLRQGPEGALALAAYGIEAVDVGVSRIKLPEETTKAVFDRMERDRERLVADIESRGQAQAQTIRATAEETARKIREFAEARAQQIRAEGEREAAFWLAKMDEKPELAVFLLNLDMLRNTLAKRVTLVFPTSLPGLRLLSPDATAGLRPGEFPGSAAADFASPEMPRRAAGARPDETPSQPEGSR